MSYKYIGEGRALGQMPKRDLTDKEAEAYSREYGGIEAMLESGLYEKTAEGKPSNPRKISGGLDATENES